MNPTPFPKAGAAPGQDGHNPWDWPEKRAIYETPWIRVEEWIGVKPSGARWEYGLVRMKKHAIGVLVLEEDASLALVGQWRVPLGAYSWEIPEGGLEAGEDPLEGAKREVFEETGLRLEHWRELAQLDLSNCLTDERATIFLAHGVCERRPPSPDETEILAQRRVPFREALNMARTGEIRDAISVCALYAALDLAHGNTLPESLAQALRSAQTMKEVAR